MLRDFLYCYCILLKFSVLFQSPESAKDAIPQDDDNTNTSEPSKAQFEKEDLVDSVKLPDSTASESDRKPAGHVKSDKPAEDSKSSCGTAASETSLSSQTRKRNHSETITESSGEKHKSSTNLDPVAKKRCSQQTENAKKESLTGSEATAGLKSGTDSRDAKKPITDPHSKLSVKSSSFDDNDDDHTTADLTQEPVEIGEEEEEKEKKDEIKVTSGKVEDPLSLKVEPQEKEKLTEVVMKDTKTAARESDSGKTDGAKKSPEVERRKSKSAEKLQLVCEKLRATRGVSGGGVNLSADSKGKKDDEKVVLDKHKTEPEVSALSKRELDCSKALEPSKELLADETEKKPLQKAKAEQKSTVLKVNPTENVPDSKGNLENSSGTVKPSLKSPIDTVETKSVEKQSQDEEGKSLSKPCDNSTRTSLLKQGPRSPKEPLREDTGKSSDNVDVKLVADKISKNADSKSSGDSLKVFTTEADASKSENDSSASVQPTMTEESELEKEKESNKTSDIKTDSADEKNLSSKSALDAETTKEVKPKSSFESVKAKDSAQGEDTAEDETDSKLPKTKTDIAEGGGSLGVRSAKDDLKSKVTTEPKVVDKAKNDQTDVKETSTGHQEKSKDSSSSKMGSNLKPSVDKPSDGKVEGTLGKKNSLKESEKKNVEDEDQRCGSLKEGTVLKPVTGESLSVGGEKLSSSDKKESAKSEAVTKKSLSAEDGEKKLEENNVVSESSKTSFSLKNKELTKDVSKTELKESSSASVSSKTADDGVGDSIGTKKPVAEQSTVGEMSSKSKEEPLKSASRESVLAEAGSVQDKTLMKPTATLIKESGPSEKSITKSTESASKISYGMLNKPSIESHTKSALEESLPKSSSLSKKELSEANPKPSSEAPASSLSKSPAKSSSEAPAKSSSKVPTKTSSEVSAKTSSETPAKSSSKVPTNPLSEDPVKYPSETPVKKSSSETTTKSSSEAPVKSLSDAPTKSSSETPTKTSSEPQSTNTLPMQTKLAASNSSSNTAADPNKVTKQAEDSSKQKKDVHLPKSQTGTEAAATKASATQDIKKEGDNKVTVIKMASATSHSNVDCSSGKGTLKNIVSHSAEAKRDPSKLSDTSRGKTTSRAVGEESRSAKHEGQTSVITPTKKVRDFCHHHVVVGGGV